MIVLLSVIKTFDNCVILRQIYGLSVWLSKLVFNVKKHWNLSEYFSLTLFLKIPQSRSCANVCMSISLINQKSYSYTRQTSFSYLGPWCVWIWFCLPGLLIIIPITELYQKNRMLNESRHKCCLNYQIRKLVVELWPI